MDDPDKLTDASADRGVDTDPDADDDGYEPCYADGSLQNECWKVE